MKKIIISISLVIAAMLCSTSCSDYLDIVPEGTPSMDNAFSNRINSFKFLHTCYSYLPSWDQGGSIGFLAGDEHWLMPKGNLPGQHPLCGSQRGGTRPEWESTLIF